MIKGIWFAFCLSFILILATACAELEDGHIPASMIPPRVIPGEVKEAASYPIKEYSPRPGVLCWTYYTGAIDCEFVPEWYEEPPVVLEKTQ